MKGLKIFAIVVGGVVLLTAVVVMLALTPSVQTWAVRRAVAGQPGVTIEIGSVAAGLTSADVGGVRIVKDGAIISVQRLTARYSAMDFLRSRKISADAISLRDLVVDLRNKTPTTAGQTPAPKAGDSTPSPTSGAGTGGPRPAAGAIARSTPFEGLLKEAQLPFDVRIVRVTANGRVLLPEEQVATFELDGANLENGKRGTLTWKADFADAKPASPLRALKANGTVGVTLSADRRITRLEVDATAAAEGPKLPRDRLKIEAAAAQAPTGGGETYALVLGVARDVGVQPLLKTDAAFDAATREISGAWSLSLRNESIAALLTGFGLPDLTATGDGKFRLNPATQDVSASGQLQANASRLEKISPELAAIGAVQLRTVFDGGMAGGLARLEKFQLEVTGSNGRKLARIDTSQRITYNPADQRVTIVNSKAELARVALNELPLAWAQPFLKGMTIDQGTLSLVLGVEAEADGSRVRTRAIEPLSLRTVTLRQGNTKLLDQVTFSASPQIDFSAGKLLLAELADLKISMPAGDSLAGKASVEVSNLAAKPAVAFSTQLQAKIVAALKPYVPVDTGPLAVAVNTTGRLEGDLLQLTTMSAKINREGGGLLADVELLQVTKADLAKKTFAVAKPADPAARLKLGAIPLNWAQSFVAGSQFDGQLASGTFEITAQSLEEIALNTIEPLVARGVSATIDGKPMVKAVDLMANLTATKQGNTVRYDMRRLEITQGKDALATLAAKGEAQLGAKLTVSAKGNLDADAGALMNQPVLAPFATLSRGRVTTVFEVTYGDILEAKAALAAKGLIARANNQALGDIDLTVSAMMKTDGSGSVTVPLTLTNGGRRSDVALAGSFGRAGTAYSFDGKITSNQLFVDDFQLLGGLAPATEPAKPAAKPSTRDAEPFWKGVSGRADVNLKKVLYGKDYTITAIQGAATLTPTRLALEKLEGRFKEKAFKLNGGITFAAQQPKPYALTASTDIQGIDVGEILRAANPNEKPVFETNASLTASLNGSGGNITELFKNAYGKFELTGTQGVTRLLARRGGASAAVNVASIGLAILGASRQSEGFSAAAELTQLLNEVRFDNVKVQVERAADLSFKLTAIEITSPLVHTSGTGSVASKSTDDVANAPMNIVLQLGAKGQLAYALQRSGLLGDKLDDKGYALMTRTFSIGGTPAKPDNTALWGILLQTALNAFGR